MANERSGTGLMEYANGDRFSGEFLRDDRNGPGELIYLNGDVYKGHFSDDMKHGPGRYFYKQSVKVYEGEWAHDNPRCGELREPSSSELKLQYIDLGYSVYPGFVAPELELLKPAEVIAFAVAEARCERSILETSSIDDRDDEAQFAPREFNPQHEFENEIMERAETMFFDLGGGDASTIPSLEILPVLYELNIDLTEEELENALNQLELSREGDLSFPEIIEIALFIRRSMRHESEMTSSIDS